MKRFLVGLFAAAAALLGFDSGPGLAPGGAAGPVAVDAAPVMATAPAAAPAPAAAAAHWQLVVAPRLAGGGVFLYRFPRQDVRRKVRRGFASWVVLG